MIKKAFESTFKQFEKKENMHTILSPRSREEGNNRCTNLMEGITKIGTQRSMKNHKKTLHELATSIPKKSTEHM
jgi:hypothetical protein